MKIVEVILDTLQLEFQAYKCKSCDSEFEKNLETFWTPLSLITSSFTIADSLVTPHPHTVTTSLQKGVYRFVSTSNAHI